MEFVVEENKASVKPKNPMRIGIAADHGGYELRQFLFIKLCDAGYEVVDFGDHSSKMDDDYPDFVIPMAQAVAGRKGRARRGDLRKRCWGMCRSKQSMWCSCLFDS